MVKPPLRTKSIGFKVSEEEYAQLETAAQAAGRTLGEWCREVILRGGQTWNRYAYVGGMPLSCIDPLGLVTCGDEGPGAGTCVDVVASMPPDVGTILSNLPGGLGAGIVGLAGGSVIGPALVYRPGAGGGSDKEKTAANNGTCPAVPQAPPGANVNSNIKISNWMKVVTYTDPLVSLYAFDQVVGNKKPWDYKQQGWTLTDTGQLGPSPFQDFGNFNFGATGAAWGIPLNVLQRGAGYAQGKAGTSTPEWGKWYQGPPYGDDPADQAQIAAGYQYYQNGCYKKK